MTATAVIEEIKHLPRAEQSRVLHFAFELARARQLSGDHASVAGDEFVSTAFIAKLDSKFLF